MADTNWVSVNDAKKGDYAFKIQSTMAEIYKQLGLTVAVSLAGLKDLKGRITSASLLKRTGCGVELAITIKKGTGNTATYSSRKFFCPTEKIDDAFDLLPGTTALGGAVVNCYAPRRADYK